jgi:tetratricopeptide (TPR) repeat protein
VKAQKFIPLLVIAAGLLAYHNSFTGPFILDDVPSILANPTIRQLWPIWPVLSPPATAGVGGRPVLNLSFAINYAFGATSVEGYHALNLAIHLLAALTLFGVVRQTLRQPALRERFGTAANALALATAVLWTVHPLQTEAVTYVSQRAESLMGLFYLLTLFCFIRGTTSPRPGRWFTLSIAACLLGMGTKEVMVTAPLMVLLYDRTFVAGSVRAAWTQRRRLYVGLGSTWLVLAYLMAGLHHRGVGYGLGVPWQAYALTECRSILQYLWLAIWPHPLIFDYGMNIFLWHLADAASYALILLVLVAGVVIGLKRWPAIGLVGAWFFVVLAPTSSVVPIAYQPMAESRMYLPLAAVIVLGVLGIHALAGRRTIVVVAVLAVALGTLTWRRNQDYRSEFAIWDDTIAKQPDNPRAQNNLGKILLSAGSVQEAIARLQQALRLKPDYAEAHNNLGIALEQTGRIPEAIGHYEQALRIRPDYAEVHYNLGNALSQEGKLSEATDQYQQALSINPNDASVRRNLATAANNLAWSLATIPATEGGDPIRAVTLAERACQLTDTPTAPYLDTLAAAYAAAGRFNDAVTTARKAIDLANSAGLPQVVKQIESRLQLYRRGRAYRESNGSLAP